MKIVILCYSQVDGMYAATLMERWHEVAFFGPGAFFPKVMERFRDYDGCLLLGISTELVEFADAFEAMGKKVWHQLNIPPTDARSPSPSRTNKSDKPAQPGATAGFAAWYARAAAALERAHGVKAGTIPAWVWRHAYVKGLTPADAAAVSAHNERSAGDRVRQNSKK